MNVRHKQVICLIRSEWSNKMTEMSKQDLGVKSFSFDYQSNWTWVHPISNKAILKAKRCLWFIEIKPTFRKPHPSQHPVWPDCQEEMKS